MESYLQTHHPCKLIKDILVKMMSLDKGEIGFGISKHLRQNVRYSEGIHLLATLSRGRIGIKSPWRGSSWRSRIPISFGSVLSVDVHGFFGPSLFVPLACRWRFGIFILQKVFINTLIMTGACRRKVIEICWKVGVFKSRRNTFIFRVILKGDKKKLSWKTQSRWNQ